MPRTSKTDQCLSDFELDLCTRCSHASPTGLVSIGAPEDQFRESEYSGQLLLWFPAGIPQGQSVSIASSRLGQKLEHYNEWFDAIRTEAINLSKSDHFLLTAIGTTTDRFLRRISALFGLPILEFEPFPKKPPAKWFAETAKDISIQDPCYKCFYQALESCELQNSKVQVDQLLIELACSVVLLAVSKKGNIRSAVQNRLATEAPSSATRLLINHRFTANPVETELRESGAVAWWLYDETERAANAPDEKATIQANILTLDEIKTDQFLAHWTRRRVGPWPDQTTSEYLDDLIFQTSRRQHSEVSALCRILASDRIMGSNDLTRDSRDVVCFSNVPLDQLAEHRVFRPHLSRWDFEPFGIAIDRELLRELGGRAVAYGMDRDWDHLTEDEKAFFQLQKSSSSEIDWTSENEWRLIGDLKLRTVPTDRAVVFVKTMSAAKTVAGLSRWPIVVLENS